jgi:hypothetical protein
MYKRYLFNSFLFLLFLTYTINIVDIVYYLFGYNLSIYQKIVSILIFFIGFLYSIIYGLKLTNITLFLLICSLLSFFIGIVNNGLNIYFLSHIYSVLMPVYLVSFGIHFKNNCNKYIKLFITVLKYSFFFNILFILIYILTHYVLHIWTYFGFATNLAFLTPFLFYRKNLKLFYISFILDFFSGKRMTLLTTIILYFRENFKSKNLIKFISLFSILLLLSFFIYLKYQDSDSLSRISNVVNVVISDEKSLSIATSGRSDEVLNLIEKMNMNKFSYFLGSGFGSSYLSYDYRGLTESEIKHYAHISPFYYIFIFGIPFTFLFYYMLLKSIKKNSQDNNNNELLFRGLFMSYFIMSFFGSILFVSPIFWFYLGTIIKKNY